MKRRIRIGILGCGTIGSQIAGAIVRKFSRQAQLTFVSDIHLEKAVRLAKTLGRQIRVGTQTQMIQGSDLIVEAASFRAVSPLVKEVLRKHRSVLVMSVGGLLSDPALFRLLKKTQGQIFLPSGAVAGIDGILAARMGKLKSVSLTTRKPAQALMGAPYFSKKKIRLEHLKKETLVFDGNAQEAVKAFPQNINVAAIVSLAGLGPKRTRVRIYASPHAKVNSHQIEITGDFGKMTTLTENVPAPTNPKTSYLATLAPSALLGKIFSTLKIGT